MKKFFASIIILLSLLTTTCVAVPFTAIVSYLPSLSILTSGYNELYIKAGVGGLMFIFSLIYFIVALVEHSRYEHVTKSTGSAAFLPMFLFTIFSLTFTLIMAIFTYRDGLVSGTEAEKLFNLIVLAALGVLIVNLIIGGHLLSITFREGKNIRRIFIFVVLLELLGASGAVSYYMYKFYYMTDYPGWYTNYYVVIPAVGLVFYIIHLIIMSGRKRREENYDDLEHEVSEIRKTGNENAQETNVANSKSKTSKATKQEKSRLQEEQVQSGKGKKTYIVSNEQSIISGEQNIDPTNLLYEEVAIDSEFNKTSNLDKQVSSIEYYIEKPKMFKPLEPTFDALVAYVRELPNVVTKITDERISFYIDRKPFLVLMNFGNYYRMAFRSDLEKGVRLIIKYPTISKNKGTKDTLWFKANNYGDLPKEVIYDIVKSAFDNVNA